MIKREDLKNKMKKRVIIGASSVIVVTICGVVGWKVVKTHELKMEEQLIEQSFLTAQDMENSYSTEMTDEEVFADEATRKQMDQLLSSLGFGYDSSNLSLYYRDNYEESFEKSEKENYDKGTLDYSSAPDKFYMWYNDIDEEDRPDYAGRPLTIDIYCPDGNVKITSQNINRNETLFNIEITVNSKFGIVYGDGITGYALEKYIQGKSETFTYQETVNGTVLPSNLITARKSQAEIDYKQSNAYNELLSKHNDYENKYKDWKEYRDKRNEWFDTEIAAHGYFSERELGIGAELDADYRNFWLNVAKKALGYEGSTAREMIDKLLGQVQDKDGNPRPKVNILSKLVILGEDYKPFEGINSENAGGTGSGGTGSEGTDPGGTSSGGTGSEGTDPGGTGSGGTGSGGTGSGGTGSGGTGSGGTGSGGTSSGGTGSGGTGSEGTGSGGTSSGGTGSEGTDPGGTGSEGKDPGGTGSEGTDPEKDNVPAKVKNVELIYPNESGLYAKGQKIQIKVDFDKAVYGTTKKSTIDKDTAPKLLIKFSEGSSDEKIKMSFESASSTSIIYSYIIQENNNGTVMLADGDNFEGVIYNKSGVQTSLNKVENLTGTENIKIDNKAPEVKSIECISESGTYDTGKEIKIKVTFDEAVYTTKNKVPIVATTAPTLLASFGSGEAKKFTFDSYSEKDNCIIYKYTITEKDVGKLKIDVKNSFDGINEISDVAGTTVKLSKGVELTGTEIIANSKVARIDMETDEIVLDLKNKEEGKDLTATVKATLVGFEQNTTITWSTGNSNVATVDNTGLVKAIKEGQAIISAKVIKDNIVKAEAKCTITIKDTSKGETKIQIPAVKDNKIEIDKNKNEEITLSGEVVKVDQDGKVVETTNQNITYISKDENIAKVEDGKIIGVTPGKTTLIGKAEDGTEMEFEVVITNSSETKIEQTGISTELLSLTLDYGKTKEFDIYYTLEPKNSNTNAEVTFSSSDENVVTVNSEGKVTIKGEGVAVITLTTANGKKTHVAVNSIDVANNELLKNILNGDYNEDKYIDELDLLIMMRHVAASKSEKINEKHQGWLVLGDKFYILDVNKDAEIDGRDILKIQQHIAASKSEEINDKHPDWKIEN